MTKRPAYYISVLPPARFGERFDIPEWAYSRAFETMRRYKLRGWGACIVDGSARPVTWLVNGHERPDYKRKLPELEVTARSSDEALMLARARDWNYDSTQRKA